MSLPWRPSQLSSAASQLGLTDKTTKKKKINKKNETYQLFRKNQFKTFVNLRAKRVVQLVLAKVSYPVQYPVQRLVTGDKK